jgi:sugar/nucleoside kinase (ribokinase family)
MGIRALSYGEMLKEDSGGSLRQGGSPFILAANICCMDGRASMYSRVGADAAGEELIAAGEKYGIDMAFVQRDNARPTGTAKAGAAEATHEPAAYAVADNFALRFMACERATVDALERMRFDVFCFQTLAPMFTQSHDTLLYLLEHINTCEVFYDLNFRGRYYSRKVIDTLLHHATIVRCNSEEMRIASTILYGKMMQPREFADTLSRSYAVPLVIVRQRPNGCAVYHAGAFAHMPSAPDDEQIPGGFGDAFNAAFLSLYCDGISPFDSAKRACKAAAHAARNNNPVVGEHYSA